MRRNNWQPTQTQYFPLKGGENNSPGPIDVKPGRLLYSKNYELDVNGRPKRVAGFCRWDRGLAFEDYYELYIASAYTVITFTGGINEPSIGDYVCGGTSQAYGVVLSVTVTSGSWAGSDAAGYIVATRYGSYLVSRIGNSFSVGEQLQTIPAPTNELSNVGFETAGAGSTFSGWTDTTAGTGSISRDGTYFNSGSYGCLVSGGGSGFCYVSQSVSVAANETFRLEVYARTFSELSDRQARIWVYDVTNSETILLSEEQSYGDFTKFQYNFIVPSGCSSIEIRLGTTYWGSSSVAFDDVALYDTRGVGSISAVGTISDVSEYDENNHDTYRALSLSSMQNDFGVVPGAYNIIGLFIHDGYLFALRQSSGGSSSYMYKAPLNASNTYFGRYWTKVTTSAYYLDFTSGGTTEIVAGQTITGATSGATAVVSRVRIISGSWAGGDAAGVFYFAEKTGTFQPENINVGANPNLATIPNDATHYYLRTVNNQNCEFVAHNFTGQDDFFYFCTGSPYQDLGLYECDGDLIVPIFHGASVGPDHIAVHSNQLFIGFDNGSVIHSAPGDPHDWTALSGASEFNVGEAITAFSVLPGGVLSIFSRNKISLLYGYDATDWELKTAAFESGAIPCTVQRLSQPVFLDDRGITTLGAVQEFGDFNAATLSNDIRDFIDNQKLLTTTSMRVRSKNQYRLFFSDNTAAIMTMAGNKLVGFTRADYGLPVNVCCSGEDENGNEHLFFASTGGMVYKMDAGTSFDGETVDAYVRLPFTHLGSPAYQKRITKIEIDMEAPSGVDLTIYPDFSFGDTYAHNSRSFDVAVSPAGAYWGEGYYGEFYWTGQPMGRASAIIDGLGTNIGLLLSTSGMFDEPHTLHSVMIYYIVRKLNR